MAAETAPEEQPYITTSNADNAALSFGTRGSPKSISSELRKFYSGKEWCQIDSVTVNHSLETLILRPLLVRTREVKPIYPGIVSAAVAGVAARAPRALYSAISDLSWGSLFIAHQTQ